MKNVLVLIPVTEDQKKQLEEKAPAARFTYSTPQTVEEALVHEASAILGNPPTAMLQRATKLEWLQLHSAGIDGYSKEGELPKGVVLTNASGAYGPAISEYMVGVLLELYLNLHLYRDVQAESRWAHQGKVKTLDRSTVLVIGAGDIGCEFAKRVKALGAYTIGVRRSDASKPECLDELHFMDRLPELLPRADVVSLSLPGSKFTRGVISRDMLKLMKRDAVILNVGRGSAIDTEALCDALEAGELLGAALDVTDPEPLPEDHRLWRLKNAVITPHVSGGFGAQYTLEHIVGICASNLEAWANGKSLTNIVDLALGY